MEQVKQSCAKIIEERFPYLDPKPVKTVACLYTFSPTHDFVISFVPEHEEKAVVVGCGSGHGFKLAPSVGYCAAALIYGRNAHVDLDFFKLEKVVGSEFVDNLDKN